MSLPQLNTLVAEALRELADASRAYMATFEHPEGPDPTADATVEAARHTAYDRKHDAEARVLQIALTLFPAPRSARARKRR